MELIIKYISDYYIIYEPVKFSVTLYENIRGKESFDTFL